MCGECHWPMPKKENMDTGSIVSESYELYLNDYPGLGPGKNVMTIDPSQSYVPWTPVDKNPEVGFHLVTLRNYSDELTVLTAWYGPLRSEIKEWTVPNVIAWAPLPEPYRMDK